LQSWADKLATAGDADALAERFAGLLKAEGIYAGAAVSGSSGMSCACATVHALQHCSTSCPPSSTRPCNRHVHKGPLGV
jgi:hypothetical protein